MPAPIEFWFDFSSPYGYIASHRIDALAAKHGRTVDWHPFLLGVAFQQSGQKPLLDVPLKGDYSKRDFARSARLHGFPFLLPHGFPFSAVAPSRAFYWLKERDAARAVALAKALYIAAYGHGRNISKPELVADVARSYGHDPAEVLAGMNDQKVKDKLRSEVDAGIAKGVFGSPFIFVDGEPFWGSDRLEQIDLWLTRGGW
jgi:2-hydroxychromene-2-carboxylate isomerase